jgi:hypothetical protein
LTGLKILDALRIEGSLAYDDNLHSLLGSGFTVQLAKDLESSLSVVQARFGLSPRLCLEAALG